MTTDTEARELVERLFGYQVRKGHTIQSGAGTKAPTLIWADADYEVGDGLCGLHPDQKQANEPSIPYARIDALLALLAENERLREALMESRETHCGIAEHIIQGGQKYQRNIWG